MTYNGSLNRLPVDNPLEYSPVFSFEKEENPFLLRKKRSIVGRFKFTVEREVEKVYSLAFWLHVFGRDREAVTVCDFLSQKEYDGNTSIWYHIERAIGLKYVIEKSTGEYPPGHLDFVKKIFDAQDQLIRTRAKNEEEIASYERLFEGLLNGQTVENELWNEDIVVVANVTDTCFAVIRELCWLIAANEYRGRIEFFIGGHKGNCELFWHRYDMYLSRLRMTRKTRTGANLI